jgi:hypothetical protein
VFVPTAKLLVFDVLMTLLVLTSKVVLSLGKAIHQWETGH